MTLTARANVLCSFVWYTDKDEARACLKKEVRRLKPPGSPIGDPIELLQGPTSKHPIPTDHIAEHRMLYPATENGPTKRPASNKSWISATACLTIISLAVILLVLAKILGIKARWTRSIKRRRTDRANTMKLAP
ncbi:unnamed protein product [Albugo candida]|uniref:Uncharacterized protein n=1 Tax=Albugo candida TaxID=65357 RepID=A0A024FXQ0_9STRA|nr:unnamed protein product [Albugo candida]|eukprot:CCI11806.1 unnamed protein product [Albugo candida]